MKRQGKEERPTSARSFLATSHWKAHFRLAPSSAHTLAHSHTRTHTRMHAHMHTHTHMHAHMHTRTKRAHTPRSRTASYRHAHLENTALDQRHNVSVPVATVPLHMPVESAMLSWIEALLGGGGGPVPPPEKMMIESCPGLVDPPRTSLVSVLSRPTIRRSGIDTIFRSAATLSGYAGALGAGNASGYARRRTPMPV